MGLDKRILQCRATRRNRCRRIVAPKRGRASVASEISNLGTELPGIRYVPGYQGRIALLCREGNGKSH
jgi:hypothetical protein